MFMQCDNIVWTQSTRASSRNEYLEIIADPTCEKFERWTREIWDRGSHRECWYCKISMQHG